MSPLSRQHRQNIFTMNVSWECCWRRLWAWQWHKTWQGTYSSRRRAISAPHTLDSPWKITVMMNKTPEWQTWYEPKLSLPHCPVKGRRRDVRLRTSGGAFSLDMSEAVRRRCEDVLLLLFFLTGLREAMWRRWLSFRRGLDEMNQQWWLKLKLLYWQNCDDGNYVVNVGETDTCVGSFFCYTSI